MANHASAKKRVRRTTRRTVVNKGRLSRMRSFIKKVELAISEGKAKDAQEALKNAQPEIYRGVSRGVLHKNTAARKMSRLSAAIKAIS